MAAPFTVQFDAADLARFRAAMTRLAAAGQDLGPAMALVAATLMDEAEANFAAEGRPSWPELAGSTKKSRAKHGHWPGPKEQVSGQLAASTTTEFGPMFAQIGQSKIYAAIQNLGGAAGRGHAAILPPRPSLPITPDGSLQPDAEEAVLNDVLDYLARVVG
jgi:phage virion morphogenesis protein